MVVDSRHDTIGPRQGQPHAGRSASWVGGRRSQLKDGHGRRLWTNKSTSQLAARVHFLGEDIPITNHSVVRIIDPASEWHDYSATPVGHERSATHPTVRDFHVFWHP